MLVAARCEQLCCAGQCTGRIGGTSARLEGQQLIAKPQVIAGQLGRLLGILRSAHDRDLGFRTELREDLARFIARLLDPRFAIEHVAGGERVVDHQHRGLGAARDLRPLARARRERLRERDRDGEAGEGADEQHHALAQLEPARGLALRRHQELERGERDDLRAAPADQMDRDRHAQRERSDQHERREKAHYAVLRAAPGSRRAREINNSSSVCSSGLSVETSW